MVALGQAHSPKMLIGPSPTAGNRHEHSSYTSTISHSVIIRITAHANDTEFQYSHSVWPVERAAAHKRKKALKKALTVNARKDALRGPVLSAHLRIADDVS